MPGRLWFMNTLAVGFLLFSALPAFADPAVIHHQLDLTLHPEKNQLAATDAFAISGDRGDPLCVLLAPEASVSRVAVDGNRVVFSFQDGRLSIPAASTKENDQGKRTVLVSYAAVFDDPVPQNPVHSEDPSYGVTGTIRPEGTLLLGGAGWYPDLPETAATFRLRVHAPAGYEAVTAGKCRSRQTRHGTSTSVWEIGFSLTNLALSAGPYVITEEPVGNTTVSTYFWQEDQDLATPYLEATAGYIRLYNNLIGSYPFEKFAVVENFFPTGYGFPSYTLLGSRVIRLPFIIDTSLGHEIAHSWWGNCVRVDYEQGNWCEGMTTYVADHLYKERSSPEEGLAYRLKILRDYAVLVPPAKDFPLRDFVSRVSPATRVVGYGKGAMVFHMARHRLGDKSFWEALGAVFSQKRFQKASWGDFAAIMGRVADVDLRPFFAQWVNRAGAPVLALVEVSAEKSGQSWVVRGNILQEAPYFTLPIPVQIETRTGQQINYTVLSSTESTPFAFQTAQPPSRLVVDPQVDLFRRLSPTEVPATVNSLKASDRLTMVFAQDNPTELMEAAKTLLTGLGQTDVPMVVEEETASVPADDRDVLFIGLPKNQAWVPSFPEGLLLCASRLVVNGQSYDPRSNAAFAVFSDPGNRDRTIGILIAPSSSEAKAAARKIPHYGKYSYLIFEKGTNTLKGTWQGGESPLIHVFPAPSGEGPS